MNRHSFMVAALLFGCSGATFEVREALESDPDAATSEDTSGPDQGELPDTLPRAPDAFEESLPDTRTALDTYKALDAPVDSYEAGASDAFDASDATEAEAKPGGDAPGCRLKGDDCSVSAGATMCCSGVCDGAGWCCGLGRCS